MNFAVFPLVEKIKEFKPWEKFVMEASKDYVFKNTFADLEVFSSAMKKHNVKPEVEVYGTNGIANTGFMLRAGQLGLPVHIQYVLGVLGGSMATPYELMHLQTETQRWLGAGNFTWSVIGVGYPAEFHLGAVAMAMGGHVRVGLEDNIWFDAERTRLATNRELVERIVYIARSMGREPLSPSEARGLLKL